MPYGRQHLWQGPRSQWLGGVQSGYDWRKIDPLRSGSLDRRRYGFEDPAEQVEEIDGDSQGRRRSRGESPQTEQTETTQQGQDRQQAVSPYHSLSVQDPQNVMGNRWVDQQIAPQPASSYTAPTYSKGSRVARRGGRRILGV
jgi:hypothetical protein